MKRNNIDEQMSLRNDLEFLDTDYPNRFDNIIVGLKKRNISGKEIKDKRIVNFKKFNKFCEKFINKKVEN